jgi:hypothetical protein
MEKTKLNKSDIKNIILLIIVLLITSLILLEISVNILNELKNVNSQLSVLK